MADSKTEPVELREKSGARVVLLMCVGIVLIGVSVQMGYEIIYTLVGRKVDGQVSSVLCERHPSGRGTTMSCTGEFRTERSVPRIVSVKGDMSYTDVRRGQLVEAVGLKPPTAYVGSVPKALLKDVAVAFVLMLCGAACWMKSVDIYREKRRPSSLDKEQAGAQGG